MREAVITVDPPPRESESIGAVENGVRMFKGMLRIHLMALEFKTSVKLPAQHLVMTWLVENVNDVLMK